MKSVALKLIKAIGFLLAAYLIYLAYYWWDMRQLMSFCDDVKAGTPVSVSQIASAHPDYLNTGSPKPVQLDANQKFPSAR
jgi:hypothetical protein